MEQITRLAVSLKSFSQCLMNHDQCIYLLSERKCPFIKTGQFSKLLLCSFPLMILPAMEIESVKMNFYQTAIYPKLQGIDNFQSGHGVGNDRLAYLSWFML
jgi:hypothetical protein